MAMDEQPATLATHVTVGTGTDAEGVAMATCRCRRELPDRGAGAAQLPQEGEHRTGTRAVGLAARGAPLVVSAVQPPLLTPWRATARPARPAPGSATARQPYARRPPCAGRGRAAEDAPGHLARSR
jgi:hypothetical protein